MAKRGVLVGDGGLWHGGGADRTDVVPQPPEREPERGQLDAAAGRAGPT